MRNVLGVVLIGLSFGAFALENDTVPLKYKTNPGKNSEPAESMLLNTPAKKSAPSLGDGKAKEANAGTPQSAAAPNKPYIASIDTFGSDRINEVTMKELLGKDFQIWLDKGLKADPSALELETRLTDKIKKKFGFATAEFSVVQYFEPGDLAIHITLDVVEPKDVERRMPFLPMPTGEFADPDNLIRTWLEYEDTALKLVEKGEIEPDKEACPASLHCPFGHKHAQLRKYEAIFSQGVKKNFKALVKIQSEDGRQDFRAAATYLLAYEKDGNKIIPLLVNRIKDPVDLIRNNSLRVLGEIAERHPEFIIPVKPVLDALAYPRVSDRTKAVFCTYHMANNSQSVREEILKSSIPDLLKMMASAQPDHRELAHSVLRRVSGRDFEATDLRSWNSWYAKLPTRAVTKK